MAADLGMNGKWKNVKSEHFEEYLKAIGVGMVARKAAANTGNTVDFDQNGDTFHLKGVSAGVFTEESTFTIGVEFTHKVTSGPKLKCMAAVEGAKLVVRASGIEGSEGVETTTTRELDGSQLLITYESGSVVCKRVYDRQ